MKYLASNINTFSIIGLQLHIIFITNFSFLT